MSMFTKIFLATVALVGSATADTKKAPAAAKTQVKPESPKPPAEIEAMAKNVVGTWRCTGTSSGMDGSSEKMTAKVTAKVDLDKWWISDVVEGKGSRGTFRMVSYSTFDAGSKKWRRISIDNYGNQYVGTSDGMKDNKLVWNLDFMGTMGVGQFKETMDPSDPKNVKFNGLISVDKGKSWQPVYEMVCKK